MCNPEEERQCPQCDGAGGWESYFGQFIEWLCCHTCNGEGVIDEKQYTEHIREQMEEARADLEKMD